MRQAAFLTCLALGGLCLAFVPAPNHTSPTRAKGAAPTYAKEIAPILNKNCVECHHPGEVAPFSLVGYDNARKWARMAADVTHSRLMPPWKASPGFGEFKNDRRLSEQDIALLQKWASAGAPRGNPREEPKAPMFADGWTLGKPDRIVSAEKPYTLGAEGTDVYRNFVVPVDSKDDLWISAMDVRAGNKKIVHHVIVFIDGRKQGRKLEAKTKDGMPGYDSFGGVGFAPDGALGGWAPGFRPAFSPAGTAMRIPAGSDLVIQVHYHKDGKPETDHTKIALYTAKYPIKKEMDLIWWFKFGINIPAGAKAHPESVTYTIPEDVTVYGMMPHMHLLGRSMQAVATLPDGTQKPLIKIDDWDFNWQMSYSYKEPLKLPKGTKVKIDAVYDNSSENPRNPNNPPKQVRWGEQTTDEMFLLLGGYTVDKVDGPLKHRRSAGAG